VNDIIYYYESQLPGEAAWWRDLPVAHDEYVQGQSIMELS